MRQDFSDYSDKTTSTCSNQSCEQIPQLWFTAQLPQSSQLHLWWLLTQAVIFSSTDYICFGLFHKHWIYWSVLQTIQLSNNEAFVFIFFYFILGILLFRSLLLLPAILSWKIIALFRLKKIKSMNSSMLFLWV